jgi:3-oxoadipate enol-lactonase
MTHVDIGPLRLAYERRGRGEPLLLVMGMSGTRAAWGEEFLDLLGRAFDVITYDHRGMGESSRADGPFTIARLAQDAVGLLDALDVDAAHVLGLSLGGMVAQEIALLHPGRVRTLTLVGTSPGGAVAETMPEETLRLLGEAWARRDPTEILRAGWEVNVSPRFASDEAAFRAYVERGTALPAPMAVTLLQLQAGATHDAADRLGEIEAPTLIVHGELDRMLPAANARVLAERIGGARLELIPGAGHLVHVEAPERVAALVRAHASAAATSG